jgi:lysophospholipase L1-like esterase
LKKITILILGAGIFYLSGIATVKYQLFPYTFLYDFKNRHLNNINLNNDYLNNHNYTMKSKLFETYETNQTNIVMLGDSITEAASWKELLVNYNITNRGISGDVTKGFIERLDGIYKLNPEYVFIMGGINDIAKGYGVRTIFNNYKILIENLKKENIKPIVQSTLFTNVPWKNKEVKKLNTLLEKYCKTNKINFINLNDNLSKDDTIIAKYTNDGIHVNSYGYKAWRNEIDKFLKQI